MRKLAGISLIVLSLALWYIPSDVIDLVVNHRPVLFGRYSQGQFAALLILTPSIWLLAAFTFIYESFSLRILANLGMVIVSSLASVLLLIWASKLIVAPRYLEEKVTAGDTGDIIQGTLRHRPPNQHYEYVHLDEPIQLRSYPNPPPGHDPVQITLNSDRNGYRNIDLRDQYDIIVVGDSFAAGSRVSDQQAWPVLLADRSDRSIYNLGTSGADISEYLNNLIFRGIQFNPDIVVLMIYEGNDFKRLPILAGYRNSDNSSFLDELKDSPVSTALKKLSRNVFEAVDKDRQLPEYQQWLSWMPIRLPGSEGRAHYYSFRPVRAIYLNVSRQAFVESEIWQATTGLLNQFHELSRQRGFELVIAYAPSKPHVVLPFVEDKISAESIRKFLSYEKDNLPAAKALKTELFNNIGSQEQVLRAYCEQMGISFVSSTLDLQEQTVAGVQTYYTYDQHWTPEGNAVVAGVIYRHLRTNGFFDIDRTDEGRRP